MGNNQGLSAHLQRTHNGLVAGMSHAHNNPQPVALLHHLCSELGQTAQVRAPGIRVTERRHHVLAVMQQLQVPQPALVYLRRATRTFDEAFTYLREIVEARTSFSISGPPGVDPAKPMLPPSTSSTANMAIKT